MDTGCLFFPFSHRGTHGSELSFFLSFLSHRASDTREASQVAARVPWASALTFGAEALRVAGAAGLAVQRDAARGGCAVVDGPLEDKTMDALEVRTPASGGL
jgi:hypothetical protein